MIRKCRSESCALNNQINRTAVVAPSNRNLKTDSDGLAALCGGVGTPHRNIPKIEILEDVY